MTAQVGETVVGDLPIVDQDLSAVVGVETRQETHQGAFATA